MKTLPATVGARLVDSYPYSQAGTRAQAQALACSGIDGLVGYLGIMDSTRLGHVLDAGLAFMPVTLAGHYDGVAAVRHCKALGLTAGCTVWFDLEGKPAWETPAEALMSRINAWADTVAAAGYQPGLYVGSPQPLTGDQLYSLRVVRYWKAPSRVQSRDGRYWDSPGPAGWCMWQMWPQMMWRDTGVFVDVDIVGQDHKGRVPSWVVADDTQEAA